MTRNVLLQIATHGWEIKGNRLFFTLLNIVNFHIDNFLCLELFGKISVIVATMTGKEKKYPFVF